MYMCRVCKLQFILYSECCRLDCNSLVGWLILLQVWKAPAVCKALDSIYKSRRALSLLGFCCIPAHSYAFYSWQQTHVSRLPKTSMYAIQRSDLFVDSSLHVTMPRATRVFTRFRPYGFRNPAGRATCAVRRHRHILRRRQLRPLWQWGSGWA